VLDERAHQRLEEPTLAVRHPAPANPAEKVGELGVPSEHFLRAIAARPQRKKSSAPTASRISTLAPSSVPIVSAPFMANFMLPVPEAS